MSKSEKSKQIQLRVEESMLALLNDRFADIDKSFDEIEEILNTHLDRFVGIHECFQGAQMELSNVREEVSHQLRKYTNPEPEEDE